jgi:hypothetical protein
MTRVTDKDVQGMFGRVVRAANDLGIDSSRWVVRMGTKSAGVAYDMFDRAPDSHGLRNIPALSNGYLGMTAKEAQASLSIMAQTMEMVHAHLNR